MSIHRLGVWAMLIGLGVSADAQAGEPCLHRLCETHCDSCQDSSSCHDRCARGKSLGFQIGIPSIRWGISLGCGHSDCRHGCRQRDCSWCCRREPPRAPLAFSVPAVTVPQQAVAVNPVLPAQSQPACPPRSQAQSEMDRLILETLLKRLEAAEARSQQQSEAAAYSATNGNTKSTEERLSELEHRLDRILDALEQ